jgi:hypothetical protein
MVELTDNYDRKQVILEEPQCPDSKVTINGLPNDSVVIKGDAFKSPEKFFAGSHGECKRADFIIVADAPGKKIILCIEMKRTKGSHEEIVQQLKGCHCLGLYCREIGVRFWDQREFLKDYKFRFVSIGHTSVPKRKTRIVRQSGSHDRPDRMMKIDWPHRLEFNHLAGG